MKQIEQRPLPLDDGPIFDRIRTLLRPEYHAQPQPPPPDPTSQMIGSIISGRTRDEKSYAAFLKLAARYRSWCELAAAEPSEVMTIIRNVQFAERKAIQLIRTCNYIKSKYGRVDISFLGDWPPGDAFAWLIRLPGVGSKVAAATLNFSTLAHPLFVVDTTVLRVLKRLGLLHKNANYDRGFRSAMRYVPDCWTSDEIFDFHWMIKDHGRRICTERRPACQNCALSSLCRLATTGVDAGPYTYPVDPSGLIGTLRVQLT